MSLIDEMYAELSSIVGLRNPYSKDAIRMEYISSIRDNKVDPNGTIVLMPGLSTEALDLVSVANISPSKIAIVECDRTTYSTIESFYSKYGFIVCRRPQRVHNFLEESNYLISGGHFDFIGNFGSSNSSNLTSTFTVELIESLRDKCSESAVVSFTHKRNYRTASRLVQIMASSYYCFEAAYPSVLKRHHLNLHWYNKIDTKSLNAVAYTHPALLCAIELCLSLGDSYSIVPISSYDYHSTASRIQSIKMNKVTFQLIRGSTDPEMLLGSILELITDKYTEREYISNGINYASA